MTADDEARDEAALCDGRPTHAGSAETSDGGAMHRSSGGHEHGINADADRRYLVIALVLLAGFMVGEVIVALLSGSLALLSDAGHMLSDVGAIGASLLAMRLAARPASGAWTFGWNRAEILSAAGSGITLLVVSGIVAFEAARRLIHPPAVAAAQRQIGLDVDQLINLATNYPEARFTIDDENGRALDLLVIARDEMRTCAPAAAARANQALPPQYRATPSPPASAATSVPTGK